MAAEPAPARARGDLAPRLARLSRELGDPARDYAILAEGNTSVRAGADGFLVKASGTSLVKADSSSLVLMRLGAVLALLDEPPADDDALGAALLSRRADQDAEPRPSVEAPLHALALTTGGASWVGHTHPTAVNAVLCSAQGESMAAGAVFPDQVVVCGQHPLLVPYVDPGLPLALEVRERLADHVRRHGSPPKAIYLRNLGLIALGTSPRELLQVTAMAVKAARVLLGTFAAGGPVFIGDAHAERIAGRADEHYRRSMLARGPG